MDTLRKILLEKDHAGIQFLKYSLSGGLAFLTDFSVFYFCALLLFSCLTPDDSLVSMLGLDVEPISKSLQLRNFWICKGLAFVASNIVAYLLNVKYVFKPGKHRMHKEVALFFAVSLAAFMLSTLSGDALIRFFGAQTTVSYMTAILFATLINYAGRKFFIFHG